MVSACQTPLATFWKKKLNLSLDNLYSQIAEFAKESESRRELVILNIIFKGTDISYC